MPRNSRFPSTTHGTKTHAANKNAGRSHRDSDKPNWFQKIPLFVKILFVLLLLAIGVIAYWQIKSAIRHSNVKASCEQSGFDSRAGDGRIHILIHLYRATPDIVARSIFGAFEAAKYPGLVHIHLFQELCIGDGYSQDVFDTYKRSYSQLHSWDVSRLSMERNFHVVNENPTQSAGRIVSLLTLTHESVLPVLAPHDIVIVPQSFYDLPGTVHLFPLTFSQDYDVLLRQSNLLDGAIYSGRIPRTSLSATSATQVTKLTSSLTHAIGYNLVVPFFKSKQHSNYLESRTTGVCSASAARNLHFDQVGFTSYTTSDRIANIGVRHATESDVPFTAYRMLRDFYAPSTKEDTDDWTRYSEKHGTSLSRPVPIVGVHEDLIVCKADTWSQLIHYAHGTGRPYVFSSPDYLSTLLLSNLIHAAGLSLLSSNHLPITAIFDHLTGASATVDAKALRYAREFEPHNWLVALRPINEMSSQLVPTKLSDPCDLIELDPSYESYAGVTSDNVTQDGFLGITQMDGINIIRHKFSSDVELERQKRMLAAIQYPLRGTAGY
jgi:hypothetical protein